MHFTYTMLLLNSVDAKLKQDANAEKNDIKLLLLGAGESGKTTIKTQMRYMEGVPPTDEENEQFSMSDSVLPVFVGSVVHLAKLLSLSYIHSPQPTSAGQT